MLRGDLLFTAPGGTTERLHVGSVAACVAPRRQGSYVVATERAFAFVEGERIVEQGDIWTDSSVRMNEGGCDPKGRFYCGSMAYDAAPGRGALYRLEVDGSVSGVFDAVTISNGLGWSPDGTTAYYVDTPTGGIDLCDADLTQRKRFVDIPADDGFPDGLTVWSWRASSDRSAELIMPLGC